MAKVTELQVVVHTVLVSPFATLSGGGVEARYQPTGGAVCVGPRPRALRRWCRWPPPRITCRRRSSACPLSMLGDHRRHSDFREPPPVSSRTMHGHLRICSSALSIALVEQHGLSVVVIGKLHPGVHGRHLLQVVRRPSWRLPASARRSAPPPRTSSHCHGDCRRSPASRASSSRLHGHHPWPMAFPCRRAAASGPSASVVLSSSAAAASSAVAVVHSSCRAPSSLVGHFQFLAVTVPPVEVHHAVRIPP